MWSFFRISSVNPFQRRFRVITYTSSDAPWASTLDLKMNIIFRILICFVAYFVVFIGNNVYRELNSLQPSTALGTQLGFAAMFVLWFLLPKKK